MQASSDFQRFLTTVRDLVTWSSGLVAIMSSTEKVHDANEAQALRAEHDRLKGEIEAREDVFSSAVQAGETMILKNHYALPSETVASGAKHRRQTNQTAPLRRI